MILRVRSCAGTWRVTVNGDNIASVKQSIHSLHGIREDQQNLSKDPQGLSLFENHNATLNSLDISHGDMIYLQGNVVRDANGGFIIEKEDEDSQEGSKGNRNIGIVHDGKVGPPISKDIRSSPTPPTLTSQDPVQHLRSNNRISNDVRQPDAVKHEQLIESEVGFDAVDVAMDLAAATALSTHEGRLGIEHEMPSYSMGLNSANSMHPDALLEIQQLRDNMRNILNTTNPPINDHHHEEILNSMAVEVSSLRSAHGGKDESLARLLQLAEAQAESTVAPKLYGQYSSSNESVLVDDEDALNHAIKLSLADGLMSSPPPLNAISHKVEGNMSPFSSSSLYRVEGGESDPKSKEVSNVAVSSVKSPLDRTSLARRRADQILEVARNGQPWPNVNLETPLPSSTASTMSSRSKLTSSSSHMVTPNYTLNGAGSAVLSPDPIPTVNCPLNRCQTADDMLMNNEDEFLASAVVASIEDMLSRDDEVTRERGEFELALAQSALEQQQLVGIGNAESEDDELRRAIEASMT